MMKSSASAPSRTTLMSLTRWLALSACSASSTSFGLSSTSRISTASGSCISVLQRQIEGRARVEGAFGPNRSTVALDNSPHQREADARAGEVFGPMQTLEYSEKLVAVAHVEADAVVFPEVRDHAGLLCTWARV